MEKLLNRRQFMAGATALAGGTLASGSVSVTAQEPAWEPLATDGSGPPVRWDLHLAADQESGTLLLYGGRDNNGASFNDTWIYEIGSASWSQLDVESPAPRFGSATAEDREKRRLYLFGGEDGATFFNDTWRFDFKSMTWRVQDDGSTVAPSTRYGLGGALDSEGNFVISHGFTFAGRFDDTWTFDTRAKSWLDVSPAPETRPLKRCLHEMATDPESGQIILFGGCSSGFGPCPQGDLWVFDPIEAAWSDITPSSGPTARSNPAMVWDVDGSRAVLFGGLADSGQTADLWQGRFADGSFSWTEVGQGGEVPAARSSHDAVILDGAVYMFGGLTTNGAVNDLWQLNL